MSKREVIYVIEQSQDDGPFLSGNFGQFFVRKTHAKEEMIGRRAYSREIGMKDKYRLAEFVKLRSRRTK